MRSILWAALATFAVGAVPSAHAQWPGTANPWQPRPDMPHVNGDFGRDQNHVFVPPPAGSGFRDQERRRDEQGAWPNTSHVIPHFHLPSAGSSTDGTTDLHPANVVPPEAMRPASEFKFRATEFSPMAGKGGMGIFRGLSWGKGGFLAGIGGTITALLGALFGRKKDS